MLYGVFSFLWIYREYVIIKPQRNRSGARKNTVAIYYILLTWLISTQRIKKGAAYKGQHYDLKKESHCKNSGRC